MESQQSQKLLIHFYWLQGLLPQSTTKATHCMTQLQEDLFKQNFGRRWQAN
jgi:hypothetical protein